MKIIKIEYPTELSKIEDIENDNIDVFVTLEDGRTYVVYVGTPKNLVWRMDKEELDYVPAGCPDIIVRKLTHENIKKALEDYTKDDAYDLKYNYLSHIIKIDDIDRILERETERDEEFDRKFDVDF